MKPWKYFIPIILIYDEWTLVKISNFHTSSLQLAGCFANDYSSSDHRTATSYERLTTNLALLFHEESTWQICKIFRGKWLTTFLQTTTKAYGSFTFHLSLSHWSSSPMAASCTIARLSCTTSARTCTWPSSCVKKFLWVSQTMKIFKHKNVTQTFFTTWTFPIYNIYYYCQNSTLVACLATVYNSGLL